MEVQAKDVPDEKVDRDAREPHLSNDPAFGNLERDNGKDYSHLDIHRESPVDKTQSANASHLDEARINAFDRESPFARGFLSRKDSDCGVMTLDGGFKKAGDAPADVARRSNRLEASTDNPAEDGDDGDESRAGKDGRDYGSRKAGKEAGKQDHHESTPTAGGKEPLNEDVPKETSNKKEYKEEKDTAPDEGKASQVDKGASKRKRGEPHVDASGLICWEGNRIYIGTNEIGKRTKVEMGNSAAERVISIDGNIVKRITVDNENAIVKEPRDNKRTVYNNGRIPFDGHILFVSKSERDKDVWVKTIEKDTVYAIFRDKEMTDELKRIDVTAPKKETIKKPVDSDGDSLSPRGQEEKPRGINKPYRTVDDARTVKIMQQRFTIKRAKSGQKVWIDEVVAGKEYMVYYDKGMKNLARSIVLQEPVEKSITVPEGRYEPETRTVSVSGQINIFNTQVYVGTEYKENEVMVRELKQERADERRFGAFFDEELLREMSIREGKMVLDKGIREHAIDNSGAISFNGERISIGSGFSKEPIAIIPGNKIETYDVFRCNDFHSPIGTIVKGENGKYEYVTKESRLFTSPSGVVKIDGQEVILGLDHAGKAMRVLHYKENGGHVIYENGEKERPFGRVTCEDGRVVSFERLDKPAPVERRVSSSGKTGFYDKDVSLHPSYSGKKVTVVEVEIGKQFTIYKDGSLKEKVMTVTVGADGEVKQRIENIRDYLGKVPENVAEKAVALGPASFQDLKEAREAGELVSELARKYSFTFEEMHALCTSAGVHVKGGDATADIKDILGHFKPHLAVEGVEGDRARIKCNIVDHLAFFRPVGQARLGVVECLECIGTSGSGTSLAELTCKRYAEAISGADFEKAWPPWLKSERGGQMELDMYSKKLNAAIEMNGPHHYTYIATLHKSKEEVVEWQKSDALKVKQCKEHGVDLIVIPYYEIYEKHKNTVKLRERVRDELVHRGFAGDKRCENLVFQTYHHGKVYYNFGRNTKQNDVLDDPKIPLKDFLQRVEIEVPAGLFKDPDMPRASKQVLALPKAESEAIGRALVRRELARKDVPIDQGLIQVARSVVKGDVGGKVHDRVVQKVLRECDGVAAVEVPVWARDKSMTGHVDIVRVDKDDEGVPRITIVDFKTEDEAEFARFVPQVEAYARMLKSQLGDAGGARVECVLFNKDVSWRWEPGILERFAVTDPALGRVVNAKNKKRKMDG